jgi:uncharacterized pyridoxamine 5'-phosphate oxidase family protein
MKEIYDYLKKNPTFFLATVEGDQPRVRPFGVVAEFEGKLYISTSNQKKVFKQMVANPKIELSAMGQDGTWLRVEATAVHDDRNEARAQMLSENDNLKGMYTVDDGKMAVLYLKDATATIYSFKGAPKVVKF